MLIYTKTGFETTSTALCACFFYLSHNQTAYKKASQEIRALLPPNSFPDRAPLKKCVYLRACIDESMRMSPSVQASLFREVSALGDTVDSHNLHPGCEIGTGIYAIHHSSTYFEDPPTFKPER
jgi:cytochrome P450